jgi:triosephosphate isomerase
MLIAGNWKLNHGPAAAAALAAEISMRVAEDPAQRDVVLFPPFISLAAVREELRGGPVRLGAQNVYWEDRGAFTGEVSPSMLIEAGCHYVIVGHSERRSYFGEDSEGVARKVAAALGAGLTPIVCVGEGLDDRDAGRATDVVRRQLQPVLDVLPPSGSEVVIAYEPVWAIGTGRVASAEQVQHMHAEVRALLRDALGDERSGRTPILYGGSVKGENAPGLLGLPDVDGALVGGASLKAETFLPIVFWDTTLPSEGEE